MEGTPDEDVPPLEDMSALLQNLEKIKEGPKTGTANNHSANGESSKEPSEKRQPATTPGSRKCTTKKSFGGFKKGFLNNPKSGAKQTASGANSDKLPFIKAKESEESRLEIPEVQDAMKIGQAFAANTEWVTGDLLNKIEKSDTLMKQMNNPRFMAAIQEFQTNPSSALLKYAGDREVQKFLQEFCSILGAHFESYSEAKGKQPESTKPGAQHIRTSDSDGADISVRHTTSRREATADDEKKIQEILNDPELKDILLDPRIQKLLQTLKTDPEKAQRVLQEGGADIQEKIKRLVDAGVLGFQR